MENMATRPTLLFYKPDEVLSTFSDSEGRATLKDFIPFSGIYSAGRLDFDSEGLLVITADGGLIHQLTDPEQHITKTYLAQVEGEYQREKLDEIEKGIVFRDYRARPCKAIWINPPALQEKRKPITPHRPVFWIRIQISEGKKHEVRKITAAVGYPCLRLVRVAIGAIGVGDLEPGKWRFLSDEEIKKIKKK